MALGFEADIAPRRRKGWLSGNWMWTLAAWVSGNWVSGRRKTTMWFRGKGRGWMKVVGVRGWRGVCTAPLFC